MKHPDEGALQALLDDELRFHERAELEAHLETCNRCEAELRSLREASSLFAGAVASLDEAPDAEQARWRFEARRRSAAGPRRGAGTGAGVAVRRAALLVLASAAVLSATVPGSPVRTWLEGRTEVAATESREATVPEATTTAADPAAAPGGVSVQPLDGRMRVAVIDAALGVELRVRMHDGPRVGVWASGQAVDAQFRTAPDRIEVAGVRGGEVRIELPRDMRHFELEVNGRAYLVQDGERLRLPGPAAETAGPEILFDVRP